MAKGEVPYDRPRRRHPRRLCRSGGDDCTALFPENSKTGGETAALPAIWDNMADFKGKFTKFGADAKAAQSSVKDLDSFKAAFGG